MNGSIHVIRGIKQPSLYTLAQGKGVGVGIGLQAKPTLIKNAACIYNMVFTILLEKIVNTNCAVETMRGSQSNMEGAKSLGPQTSLVYLFFIQQTS